MAVKKTPRRKDDASANATHELVQLQAQIEAARAVLIRLLQDTVLVESPLGGSPAAQLVEVNEQLVIAALSAQTDAQTAAQALIDVARSSVLDPLTKLPNRALLFDRLTHAIASAKRRGVRMAVLFLDVNDFKAVNDTLGHAAGDAALRLVARRLEASFRAADTVGRYGGDEFLILLSEISQRSDAIGIANKVNAALAMPTRVGEHVLRLAASIGIAMFPDDGDDATTLIGRADAAMYDAKHRGLGNFAFHGEAPADAQSVASRPLPTPQTSVTPYEVALAEYERRHTELREANERLVMAALNAQELKEAAEQAQRRQAEFLALVAQELRNPMAPIRIATAMLGRADADEPLLRRLQGIVEPHVAEISRFVSDLLEVSQVGPGTLSLERTVVDMAAVIDEAVAASRALMDTRLQLFELDLPKCALEMHGDPIRLAQVVRNLLDNASKFTPEGGRITLAVEIVGDTLLMTVSDTGIGITAEVLPLLFKPFMQDVRAIGYSGVGLGIGLTVVRVLVEGHDGSVVAHSAGSGLGSQFIVTLPRVHPVAEHRA